MFSWLKKKPKEDPLAPFRDQLERLGTPAVRIVLDTPGKSGSSFFGGAPWLPSGESWPTDPSGSPRLFLAQVDFAQVHREAGSAASPLPSSGVLQFFVEDDNFVSDDEGSVFSLLFHRSTEGLTTRSGPALPKVARAIRFEAIKSWPYESSDIGLPSFEDDASDAYLELRSPGDGYHRMLGFADPIQDDPKFDLPNDGDGWTLLLQIISDDELKTCWYDGGAFYVYIPNEALARQDFSAAKMVFQSC